MSIVCEIVRDLTPICVDGTASKMSSNFVNRHKKRCKSCQAYYRMCKNSTDSGASFRVETGENKKDLIYLPDDGYALIAERVDKSLRTERIAIISAAVAAIVATVLIFVFKGNKNK